MSASLPLSTHTQRPIIADFLNFAEEALALQGSRVTCSTCFTLVCAYVERQFAIFNSMARLSSVS